MGDIMREAFGLGLILSLLSCTLARIKEDECSDILDIESEGQENWHGVLQLGPYEEDMSGWTVVISFTQEVDWVESIMATVSGSGTAWTLRSKDWDGNIAAGDILKLEFIVDYSGARPDVSSIFFDTGACDDVLKITSETTNSWNGELVLSPSESITSWTVSLEFSSNVDRIESIMSDVEGSGTSWTLTSKEWDGDIAVGETLTLKFIVDYSVSKPSLLSIQFNDNIMCMGGSSCNNPIKDCSKDYVVEEDKPGQWRGLIKLSPEEDISFWTLDITFDNNVDMITSPMADATGSGTDWTLSNVGWDGEINAGESLELRFFVNYGSQKPIITSIQFNGDSMCNTGGAPGPGPDPSQPDCSAAMTIDSQNGDFFSATINLTPSSAITSWEVVLSVDAPLSTLSTPMADVSGSGCVWTMFSKGWDGSIDAGATVPLAFSFTFEGSTPPFAVSIVFNGDELCIGATAPDPTTCVSSSDGSSSATSDLFGGSRLTDTNPPWNGAGHPISPSGLFGTGLPFPTNVWWQNMVLENGDLINAVNPYIVKTMAGGLHVCLPTKFSDVNYVAVAFTDNVVMAATENIGSHQVTKYDELSVTVTWSDGRFEAPIARGMPYATVFYDNLTPSLRFGGAVLSPSGQVSGEKIEVTLNNEQHWIIYASSPITFNVNGANLDATGPFSGSIRVAGYFNWNSVDVGKLDECSGRIPTGGIVSAEVQGDMAYMKFNWQTTGNGELLMMALPHHLDTLQNPQTGHQLEVLKGVMVGVTGDVWTFNEPLTPIEWGAPRTVPSDKMGDIKAALQQDIPNVACCSDDPYFGGKQMAVLARLALIADEMGESGLAQQARDRVKPFIQGWLGGTNGNTLLYDQTWGGVVSQCGLYDQGCDFGNGMYNDHHFHYGYHIYTAAVIAKTDSEWGNQWNDKVLHMISDVAEPSGTSPFYPFTRTKDWYDGHAWASGIFMFADGKNQESTSESVNGWYAIYLYGLVMGNTRVKDLGRLMTALEIRAAHRYWQMTDAQSVFPKPFADHKAVGIQWSTKVDYGTWFGANVEFIHCIQMLPFTPISEELLREEWIKEEYNVLAEAYGRPDPPLSEGWKGYIVMAHAVIDPHAAYGEALQLSSYDDGNTKSNTLYWIATRPGMGGGPPGPTTTTTHGPTDHPTPPHPTTTTSTQPPNPDGCCGPNSAYADACNDPGSDAYGGLGCNACNIQNCRICGIDIYPPC